MHSEFVYTYAYVYSIHEVHVHYERYVYLKEIFTLFTLFGYSRFSWGEWKTIADFTSPAIYYKLLYEMSTPKKETG